MSSQSVQFNIDTSSLKEPDFQPWDSSWGSPPGLKLLSENHPACITTGSHNSPGVLHPFDWVPLFNSSVLHPINRVPPFHLLQVDLRTSSHIIGFRIGNRLWIPFSAYCHPILWVPLYMWASSQEVHLWDSHCLCSGSKSSRLDYIPKILGWLFLTIKVIS